MMNRTKAIATPWNDVAPMLLALLLPAWLPQAPAQLLRVLAASVKNWCNVG
jgi:hypothetical protein